MKKPRTYSADRTVSARSRAGSRRNKKLRNVPMVWSDCWEANRNMLAYHHYRVHDINYKRKPQHEMRYRDITTVMPALS